MKKAILLLSSLLLFCCSSEVQNTTQNSFKINAVPSSTVVNVDQEFTITLSSTENMTGILYSFDNFSTERGLYSSFGTTKTLKFNLDKLGINTIYLKAVNASNISSEIKVIPITVIRGNAIKILGLQVVSFNGINTSWDPEFPVSDPNHLADVFFGFNKASINSPFADGYNYRNWYTSTVKQNQGDLTWSFATENLYIQPERTVRMGLVDQDTPPLGQDLMNGPPDYRDFNFSSYSSTKPTTITFTYPEINLEFVLTIEWSN